MSDSRNKKPRMSYETWVDLFRPTEEELRRLFGDQRTDEYYRNVEWIVEHVKTHEPELTHLDVVRRFGMSFSRNLIASVLVSGADVDTVRNEMVRKYEVLASKCLELQQARQDFRQHLESHVTDPQLLKVDLRFMEGYLSIIEDVLYFPTDQPKEIEIYHESDDAKRQGPSGPAQRGEDTGRGPYNESTPSQGDVSPDDQHPSRIVVIKPEDESSLGKENIPWSELTRPEQMIALMRSGGPIPVSELAKLFDGTDNPVLNVYNNVPRANELLKGRGKRIVLAPPAYQLIAVKEEADSSKPKRRKRSGRPQKSPKSRRG